MKKEKLLMFFHVLSVASMVFNIVNLVFAIDTRKKVIFFDAMYDQHKDELHDIYYNSSKQVKETQLSKVIKKNTLTVVVEGSDAFWVDNHTFYRGRVINGEIDSSNASPIDVFNASKSEIKFLFNVLDDINDR